MYAEEDDPRSPKYRPRQPINFTNLHIDWYGFSDAWATQMQYPNPILRPATLGEESPDLREPKFSKCTTPVVWYINYLYIFGEFYMRTATGMYIMEKKGWIDRNMTMVLAALNMDLEEYHHKWLQPFTDHSITTFSHFSARLPRQTRETYTAEGTHERCYENMYVCSIEWLNLWEYPRPFHSTAHYIMKYYEKYLAPPTDELKDPSVLKVGRARGRKGAGLSEAQLRGGRAAAGARRLGEACAGACEQLDGARRRCSPAGACLQPSRRRQAQAAAAPGAGQNTPPPLRQPPAAARGDARCACQRGSRPALEPPLPPPAARAGHVCRPAAHQHAQHHEPAPAHDLVPRPQRHAAKVHGDAVQERALRGAPHEPDDQGHLPRAPL
jgi:hypothetical protein